MYDKTLAIVLSGLKYSDNSLIVKCFTENYGTNSYLLKGILSRKKGGVTGALFQPLTQLELVATHKNGAVLPDNLTLVDNNSKAVIPTTYKT